MIEGEDDIVRMAYGLAEVLRRHPEMKDLVQQCARETYAEYAAPQLVEMVEGTWLGAVFPEGEQPVTVALTFCERLGFLDMLVRYGMGTTNEASEEEIIGAARARLEEDVNRELGISLEELLAQCAARPN